MAKVLLVDERRIVTARVFVCSACRLPTDDVMGQARGPLRKCHRCPASSGLVFVVQEAPSNKKNMGPQPSSRIRW